MNVFNVHVNRAPVAGNIKDIIYVPGKFINASLDKASEHNERNILVLENNKNEEIIVVQIAGLIARRILSFVNLLIPEDWRKIWLIGLDRELMSIYLPITIQK